MKESFGDLGATEEAIDEGGYEEVIEDDDDDEDEAPDEGHVFETPSQKKVCTDDDSTRASTQKSKSSRPTQSGF